MEILPAVLFLLGIIFLLLGWRWQGTSNQETKTALKGLAYLKRDFRLIQDQINILQDQIRTTRQALLRETKLRETELREVEYRETELREAELREAKLREAKLKETILKEVEQKKPEQKEPESKRRSNLYVLNDKEQRRYSGGVEQQRVISPKYQEALELAANGYSIPDIAQRLLLSQDAVMMVLKTQPKGETR